MKKITITGKVYDAIIEQERPGFRFDEESFNTSRFLEPRKITFCVDSYEGLNVKIEPTKVKSSRKVEIKIVLFVKKKGEK